METSKIEYRISYLNSLNGFGYLHFPYTPYDLAVLHDGKRVTVKPIIEVLRDNGFFNFKKKSYYLRDFAFDDGSHIPPDWAIDWLNDRIIKRPFKVDMRMSDMDRFMLDGAIKRRQHEMAVIVKKLNE